MSDSAERPAWTDRDPADELVPVELTRGSWETIVGILSAGGVVSARLADMIATRVPPPPIPFPVRLGAVVRALHKDGELTLVRTSGATREPTYLHWREAEDGRFYSEADVRVIEILASGVQL